LYPERLTKKYGREVDNRVWVKVHLMCGAHTKIVSSVEVSGWTVHDTNYFVPLVQATAEYFQLRDVSADKAYLSRKNLQAVEELGGTPCVPFKEEHPRADDRRGFDVGEDVLLLHVQPLELHGALQHEKQH
jgi:Transposase DDE domain